MPLFLIGFIGISSWISQSLMDFAIVILFFLLAFSYIKNHSSRFVNIPVVLSFSILGYFLVACLGYIINARPEANASENLAKFMWVFQLTLFYVATRSIDWIKVAGVDVKKVLRFFIWLSLAPSLYAFNIYLFEGVDIITMKQTGFRAIGLLNSATYHGLIGGLLFSFMTPLVIIRWSSFDRDVKITSIICLVIIFMSTVLTMTRGVWLSLFAAITIIILILKQWKLGLSVIIGATIAAGFLAQPLENFLKHRSGSDNCRVKLIETHIRIFQSYPLLGIGYRDNLREIKDFWPASEIGNCAHLRDDGNHAHNQYLNVLATTGLLGFLLFMTFHLYFLIINILLIKKINRNEPVFALITSCFVVQIFFWVSNLTETSFEYGKVRILLLITWAIVLSVHQNLSSKTPQPDSH